MKLKNAVVGTKVQVKQSSLDVALRGAVGVIVDVDWDEHPLVQFDTEYPPLTDTRRGFINSRFMYTRELKRIKE